jgi:hypothetical protein
MPTCCIPGCDNELAPKARLRTCATCRQSLHAWERRRPAEILERAHKLKKFSARMNTFSVVVDDELQLVDHPTLERKRLLSFPFDKTKRKAKSNIVQFKIVNKRKTA